MVLRIVSSFSEGFGIKKFAIEFFWQQNIIAGTQLAFNHARSQEPK